MKPSLYKFNRSSLALKIAILGVLFGFAFSNIAAQEGSNNLKLGEVRVFQSESITRMLDTYLISNASRPGMQGFRVRIFFDLGQQSRKNSEDLQFKFMETFPGIPAYRTFDSPYYKVSVGDFRTRDEALRFLKVIEKQYPKAFVVSEWINFPQLN